MKLFQYKKGFVIETEHKKLLVSYDRIIYIGNYFRDEDSVFLYKTENYVENNSYDCDTILNYGTANNLPFRFTYNLNNRNLTCECNGKTYSVKVETKKQSWQDKFPKPYVKYLIVKEIPYQADYIFCEQDFDVMAKILIPKTHEDIFLQSRKRSSGDANT